MDGCELLKESGGALHALGRATWAAVRLRALQGRRAWMPVRTCGNCGALHAFGRVTWAAVRLRALQSRRVGGAGVDNEDECVDSEDGCVDNEDESVDNEDVCVDSGDGCMLTKRFPGPGPDRYLARFRSVAIAAVVAHPDHLPRAD